MKEKFFMIIHYITLIFFSFYYIQSTLYIISYPKIDLKNIFFILTGLLFLISIFLDIITTSKKNKDNTKILYVSLLNKLAFIFVLNLNETFVLSPSIFLYLFPNIYNIIDNKTKINKLFLFLIHFLINIICFFLYVSSLDSIGASGLNGIGVIFIYPLFLIFMASVVDTISLITKEKPILILLYFSLIVKLILAFIIMPNILMVDPNFSLTILAAIVSYFLIKFSIINIKTKNKQLKSKNYNPQKIIKLNVISCIFIIVFLISTSILVSVFISIFS